MYIRKTRVAPIEDKNRRNLLRWFGYVKRQILDASVRICDLRCKMQGKRGRRRPKKIKLDTLNKNQTFNITKI